MSPSSGRNYVKAGDDLYIARVTKVVQRKTRISPIQQYPPGFGDWEPEYETVGDYGPYGTAAAAQNVGSAKAKIYRWDRSNTFRVLESKIEILKASPKYEVIRATVVTERSTTTKENTSS